MYKSLIMSVLAACVVGAAAPRSAAAQDTAADRFDAGQALLAKADFDGALQAFKAAARLDTANQEYAQQYAVLRQVILLRENLPQEQDAEKWSRMAGGLRTFYYDHGLYAEALPLDEQRHQQHPSAESAVLLAETQMALDRNSEAVVLLSSLPDDQFSPRATVLHGLALARLQRLDEARGIAEATGPVTDGVGPEYFYDLARLQVLVGNSEEALPALTRAFELTRPSRLDARKAEVQDSRDFGPLLASADFATVLKTSSKVKESKCSKGAGCGKCPKKSKCGSKTADHGKGGK